MANATEIKIVDEAAVERLIENTKNGLNKKLSKSAIVTETFSNRVAWDGNASGHVTDSMGITVKVSDSTPTLDDLADGFLTLNLEDGELCLYSYSVDDVELVGDAMIANAEVVIVPADNYILDHGDVQLHFPEAGTYFVNSSIEDYPIREFIIPDHDVFVEYVLKPGLVGNADTATKATQDGNGNVIANTYATKTELSEKLDKTEGSFFIEGSGTTNSTDKISTWVGTSDRITEYYDGLTIRYKIGVAGQSTVTLNINGLGAKTVYRFSTTKLTTQFPVGSILTLIYHSDLNDGCWITNDYDANTNTYQRVYSSTTNVEYPITARYNTTTGASYYAEYGRYSTGVTLNPSTKTITASKFKGALVGNADTATKATQDGNGNVIANTYATKAELESIMGSYVNSIDALLGDTSILGGDA